MKDFVTNVDIKAKNHNLCLKDISKYTRDSCITFKQNYESKKPQYIIWNTKFHGIKIMICP